MITPNLPEAAALLDAPLAQTEAADARAGASACWRSAPRAVLIKGGHGEGAESVDLLVAADVVHAARRRRIATRNTHGTGCTLSSAIAAGLAKGLDLAAASREAKVYVSAAIAASRAACRRPGHGPVHHFHTWW